MLTTGKRTTASEMLSEGKQTFRHTVSMRIGDQIRAARHRIGWTQRQLAKEVSVSPGAVAQWEGGGGGKGITTDNLVVVSRVLQIPLSELVSEGALPAPFTITASDEIALVELYRRMSANQREVYLALFYTAIGEKPEQKNGPAKRVKIVG